MRCAWVIFGGVWFCRSDFWGSWVCGSGFVGVWVCGSAR